MEGDAAASEATPRLKSRLTYLATGLRVVFQKHAWEERLRFPLTSHHHERKLLVCGRSYLLLRGPEVPQEAPRPLCSSGSPCLPADLQGIRSSRASLARRFENH